MKRASVMMSILIAAVMLALCLTNAEALTINLWDAFPDTQGQNNFYAYAYNVDTHTYRLLADGGAYSFTTPEQGWSIPYLIRDSVSPWIMTHPSSIPQVGTVWGKEDTALGYLSSESASYNLSGTFAMRNTGQIRVYLRKNDSELWSSVISNYGSADFDYDVYLAAGDMLYFGVSANGADYSDGSRFKGVISSAPVPEPSCLFLLSFGFLGLLLKKTI